MSEQKDEERGVVWTVLIGVVLLAISLAVGMGLYRSSKGTAGAAAGAQTAGAQGGSGSAGAPGMAASEGAPAHGSAPTSTAAMTAGASDGPSIRVENGVVKFYFASGSAELAPGAQEALGDVVKGVAAGQKAVISGFHDVTGDAARNEELAKQRAFAVRDALTGLGIGEDKLELKKPEVTSAGGSNAEARRVEVRLE